jgi:GTP pyrophosphokinase
MVTLAQQLPKTNEGHIDVDSWLNSLSHQYSHEQLTLIEKACRLALLAHAQDVTPYGEPIVDQNFKIANILVHLQLDHHTISAALLSVSIQYTDLNIEDVSEQLGEKVSLILNTFRKITAIGTLFTEKPQQDSIRANNLRKMLLAMVDDARVVLIALAQRICIMRAIKSNITSTTRQIAQETKDIYAPLANRLGIAQIKWELEDLCFFVLENVRYKEIAKLLDEKRVIRDQRIIDAKETIRVLLEKHKIEAKTSGRSKHIFSIHLKMKRKNLPYSEVYDASAIRIFVDKADDCYSVLSMIHSTWKHVSEEFDDYVSNPKPNGYQSIHTVIITPDNKYIEVQIRTHKMHEHAEYGVAAHWVYKEGRNESAGYEEKINRLRQLLDWHKEVIDEAHDPIFEDRVYVFTPEGDIHDLPKSSTPLDFAYRIHSSIGHRCRGAKVNNKMVPLTYQLKTGETVMILTAKEAKPSRDWLNPELGYIVSSRARAKVHHWFNKQYQETHVAQGKQTVEKELTKLRYHHAINFDKIAHQLNFKNSDSLFSALNQSSVKLSQIISLASKDQPKPIDESPLKTRKTTPVESSKYSDFIIHGLNNLMASPAQCCKPVNGDDIIGYITQGHGVTIHRKNCKNMLNLNEQAKQKLVEAAWGNQITQHYTADLIVHAQDAKGLTQSIASIISNANVNIISLSTKTNINDNTADYIMTLAVPSADVLNKLLDQINHIPQVINITRKG